jgi:hypothetical protein
MMLNRFSKFKVRVQFQQKGIAGYSNTQGARGAGGWGWGFNTPSQSLVNALSLAMRKKTPLLFCGTTLYDGRVVPTTVETLDITLKPILLILMLGKRMLISNI